MKRKICFPFAFLSFFRNFARILSFSLYKGCLGDWGKTGFLLRQAAKPSDDLVTILNSTFCYELLSMNTWCWACNHLWLIIGCKVTNKWAKHQFYLSIFERENSNSFAWLVQELRDIVSKVIISVERAKSIHIFSSELTQHLWTDCGILCGTC